MSAPRLKRKPSPETSPPGDAAVEPIEPAEADARIEIGGRHADARRRRGQRPLGGADVGPARAAGPRRRRPGSARPMPAAPRRPRPRAGNRPAAVRSAPPAGRARSGAAPPGSEWRRGSGRAGRRPGWSRARCRGRPRTAGAVRSNVCSWMRTLSRATASWRPGAAGVGIGARGLGGDGDAGEVERGLHRFRVGAAGLDGAA